MNGRLIADEIHLSAWQTAWGWTTTVVYYILWPVGTLIFYIVILVLFILKLLYRPVAFLLQPLVYLGRFLFACAIAPLRLLAKLEVSVGYTLQSFRVINHRMQTLYIYLGVAAIVGIFFGMAMAYVYGSLASVFLLDSAAETPSLRTAKEYRESRRKQKPTVDVRLMSPTLPLSPNGSGGTRSPVHLSLPDGTRTKGRRSKGFLDQAIMEEDSDF